jgi:hypothetical protein
MMLPLLLRRVVQPADDRHEMLQLYTKTQTQAASSKAATHLERQADGGRGSRLASKLLILPQSLRMHGSVPAVVTLSTVHLAHLVPSPIKIPLKVAFSALFIKSTNLCL